MNYETDTVLCTRKTEERDRLMKTHDKRTIQHGRSTIDLLGGGGGGRGGVLHTKHARFSST